jgi:hypothetical protein
MMKASPDMITPLDHRVPRRWLPSIREMQQSLECLFAQLLDGHAAMVAELLRIALSLRQPFEQPGLDVTGSANRL